MAERNVKVSLVMDDGLSGRLALAAEAGRAMAREWSLRDATWEPHDWGDFQ